MTSRTVGEECAKALRILEAEQRDGLRDRIVIGGLAGFAAGFRDRLHRLADDSALLQPGESLARLLADYDRLTPEERRARIALARRALGEATATTQESASLAASARSVSAPRQASPASQPVRTPPPPPSRPTGPSTVVALPAPPGLSLESPLADVKGIGPQRARLYARLGLTTVRDLLFHLPARHLQLHPPCRIADLFFQPEGSVEGILSGVEVEDLPRGLKRYRATVRDGSGTIAAVWLRHGLFHLGIKPGERIALSGKLQQVGRQLTFDNPDYERAEGSPVHTRGLVPVYPLTARLFEREVRGRVHWAVMHFAESVEEPLPASMRLEHGLPGIADALRAIHFPASTADLDAARGRLAFEELLTIQLMALQRRRRREAQGAPVLTRHDEALAAIEGSLPFTLTGAQRRVLEDALRDMASPRPMTRLLQGEVGSGKTAVAAMALVNAIAGGFQGAIMAPTEILAEQHFGTLSRFYDAATDALTRVLGRAIRVRLLTGSTSRKERDLAYTETKDGSIDVLVGTQALIQEKLEFARLGLVVVDEQHRFGVRQRMTLGQRDRDLTVTPHLLVMTATPIPRTLALSLYGDLDLSVIDELPPGRQPVRTVLLTEQERPLAYRRIRHAVSVGQQAFVICPLVEESEVLEVRAATEEYERLRTGELADVRLGLVHGRMKPRDKDAVMRAFRDHELDVLVSTAVVEVGVDVPNATIMLIEGADRFGLAQLHQFRGRVGRGEHASECILLAGQGDPGANERLRAMARSASGLELAEMDLQLRGPGDYFGVRQSGLPELRVARLDDAPLVEAARRAADTILERDVDLARPEHAALRDHVISYLARAAEPN